MIRTAEEVFPEAIFAVHLDHGTEEVCYDCIDSGFYSSVMIDASHEAFDKNIEITRRVVERGPRQGHVVEAELGQLGGVEEDIVGSVCLTEPDQAAEFVEQSGCDSLAVAIGTSHGAFKFTGKQGLHIDRIAEIQNVLPKNFPLVMHGSSSVPKEWVDRINAAGGKMKATSGVRRKPVPAGRQAGRVQGEYRHRRPPGLVRDPSRGVPRRPGQLRPSSARQGVHEGLRRLHRAQEQQARLRRAVGMPAREFEEVGEYTVPSTQYAVRGISRIADRSIGPSS